MSWPIDGVLHLISNPRGNGKTHVVAQMAQKKGRDCILVCANRQEMQRIKREYPGEYQTTSIDAPIYNLMGARHGVVLFDHWAWQRILNDHWHLYRETMGHLQDATEELTRQKYKATKLRTKIRDLLKKATRRRSK